MKKIQEIEQKDRPREKLIQRGPQALTDLELLSLLLGAGSGGQDVFSLARQVQCVLDSKNGSFKASDLLQIKGLGMAKACLIAAALEFSGRRIKPAGVKIAGPQDVLPLVQHYLDRKQECFICISLNGAHHVIATRVVTIGLANACQVHPREVLSDPLTDRACAVVVAHNHPSGDLEPSSEDIRLTKRLQMAAEIVGIELLDHIIFARTGIYSFKEHGHSQ